MNSDLMLANVKASDFYKNFRLPNPDRYMPWVNALSVVDRDEYARFLNMHLTGDGEGSFVRITGVEGHHKIHSGLVEMLQNAGPVGTEAELSAAGFKINVVEAVIELAYHIHEPFPLIHDILVVASVPPFPCATLDEKLAIIDLAVQWGFDMVAKLVSLGMDVENVMNVFQQAYIRYEARVNSWFPLVESCNKKEEDTMFCMGVVSTVHALVDEIQEPANKLFALGMVSDLGDKLERLGWLTPELKTVITCLRFIFLLPESFNPSTKPGRGKSLLPTSTMPADFTVAMPPEVLSRIARLANSDTDLHRLLYINRRMFRISVPLRYESIHFDTYLTLHNAAPMFASTDEDRLSLYNKAPKHVIVGHRMGTPAWDLERTFTVLITLTAVKTLEISHLPNLQYEMLPRWLSGMDSLESLVLRSAPTKPFMPRYDTPTIPSSFPSLTHLHVINFRWTTIHGTLDQSTSSIAYLSSIPTLRSLSTDVRSWIAMGRGRWCERLSFPADIIELEIVVGPESNVEDLKDEAWARNLFRALRDCRKMLQSLRVELPYGTCTTLDAPIVMPRLKVVVGPEGLFRNLELHGPVAVLWMTSCNIDSDIEPDGWESILPALRNPSTLRMLRVGSWDTQTLNVSATLARFPSLEELWLTTGTQLTKGELVQLGNAFVQCPKLWNVSVLGPSGFLQPHTAAVDVATAWRALANHIGSVRLTASEKWYAQYDWDKQTYTWSSKSKPYLRGFKQTNLPSRLAPVNLLVPPYNPDMDGVVEYPTSDSDYETSSESGSDPE
ncbi:hypothetical protein V5O48_004944 [Marasmius crinis-equi]|uniref:F-box domain-containing protein n=1 Tax=Marasmius crinis-equi TaxID=585013 RepID=A0ABR3FNS3_9AGAR